MQVWIIRILSLLAAVLSGWLLWTAYTQSPLPGCSADGGCGDVLGSRWASVLGLPVSLPALAAYLAMAGLTLGPERLWARRGLALLAVAVIAGIVWFVALQLYLQSFCIYCMITHGLGLVAAVTALKLHHPPIALLGLLPVVLLASQQIAFTPTPQPIFGGFVNFYPTDYPTLGEPNAEVAIAYLYDVNCPVCRRMHGELTQAVDHFGRDRLVVAMLPVPFDGACNPAMTRSPPGFETSCDLARLSLAVWLADPSQFEAFDRFLFTQEQGTTLSVERATLQAEKLVGAEPLQAALADPRIDQAFADHAELFNLLERGLPRLIVNGKAYPPLATRQDLFTLLEQETALQSPR